MNIMEQHKGTFKPKRTDDLTAGASECIGMCWMWETRWSIEEGQCKGK